MKSSEHKRKRKNNNVLSFSLVKANLGFSIGLFLLFLAGTVLIVMTSLVPESVETSIEKYSDEYHLTQGTISTDIMDTEVPGMHNVKGIKDIESNLVFDTNIRLSGGTIVQMGALSVENKGIRKFHFRETSDHDYFEPYLWVTNYLAQAAGLHAGDYIDIKAGDKYENIKIGAVVSTPDAFTCTYDSSCWNEDMDYGYIFIPREVIDSIFPNKGQTNVRNIAFEEGLSLEQRRVALDNLSALFGSHVKTAQIYEDTRAKASYDSIMGSLISTCSIFPSVVLVILLVCSCLFLYQIINNQRKRIGLLMGLGYSKQRIVNFFLKYLIAIIFIAIVIGSIIAVFVSSFSLKSYQELFDVPKMIYVLSPRCYLILWAMILTGVLSCIWSARGITKIDPSEAYESSHVVAEPYKFKLPFFNRINSITKFCLAKIFSKKGRTIATSLSISASMIMTFCSISAFFAKAEGLNYVENERYQYDYFATFDNNDSFIEQVKNINGVLAIEPVTYKLDTIDNKGVPLDIQIHAINEGSSLIKIQDEHKNIIYPTDGIILEEYIAKIFNLKPGDYIDINGQKLKINDTAREFMNMVHYVSHDTMKQLGQAKPNACVFKVDKSISSNQILESVSNIDGFGHLKIKSHQIVNKIASQSALDIVFYGLIILAIFIGLIIIFNMIVIVVNERKFEYATLIALGVEKKRFRKNIFMENFILYLLSLLIAVVPSYFLSIIILDSMSGHLQEFPFVNIPQSYLITIVISVVYIISGIVYTMRRIKTINPAVELNLRG